MYNTQPEVRRRKASDATTVKQGRQKQLPNRMEPVSVASLTVGQMCPGAATRRLCPLSRRRPAVV